MKAKQKEEKKNLTAPELRAELRTAQEKLFRLHFKHRSAPLPNPLELRTLRRHAARLKTWIGEKEAPKQ